MTTSQSKRRELRRSDFTAPALLLVLSAVPLVAGSFRLLSLATNAVLTPENARFVHSPVPIALHVASASLFSTLGAFQFSRGVRQRFPAWHRKAGRLIAVCGLLTGASGLWMTVVYPIPSELQGPLLYGVRLLVATAMMAAVGLAWLRALQRDFSQHQAFMVRAYALAQGAGTQVLVLLPWMLLSGESGGLTRDMLMTLAWLINLVVAEVIIRKRADPVATKAPIISHGTA
jgi:hypothetical protein